MRLPAAIRDNLVWILIPMLVTALAVAIALFLIGEFDGGSSGADFVYPL